MVFFKLTPSLVEIIAASGLQGLVGCQKYCDRQWVSYGDVDKVLQTMAQQHKEAKGKLEKREEHEKKRGEMAKEGADPDQKRHFELMEYVAKDMSNGGALGSESKEELDLIVKDLEKYASMSVRDCTLDAEIVFSDEHICNDNLKKRGKDEAFLKPEERVEDHEKSKVSLESLAKVLF